MVATEKKINSGGQETRWIKSLKLLEKASNLIFGQNMLIYGSVNNKDME